MRSSMCVQKIYLWPHLIFFLTKKLLWNFSVCFTNLFLFFSYTARCKKTAYKLMCPQKWFMPEHINMNHSLISIQNFFTKIISSCPFMEMCFCTATLLSWVNLKVKWSANRNKREKIYLASCHLHNSAYH